MNKFEFLDGKIMRDGMSSDKGRLEMFDRAVMVCLKEIGAGTPREIEGWISKEILKGYLNRVNSHMYNITDIGRACARLHHARKIKKLPGNAADVNRRIYYV